MAERTTPRSPSQPDVLARLKWAKHRTKLLDNIIDEILQLKAAAAAAQEAADRWQARAQRAEREIDRLRSASAAALDLKHAPPRRRHDA